MKKLSFEKCDSVYMVYDKVANYPIGFFIANCDGEACRKAMLSLRVPLRDSTLFQIGYFETGFLTPNFSSLKKMRKVDWSCYSLPETVAEAIAPLGASPEEIREIVESVAKKGKVENE